MRILPALVEVRGKTSSAIVTGTGFIVDSKRGYILTATHVVANTYDDSLTVTFRNAVTKRARWVAQNSATDIALLQTEPTAFPELQYPTGLDSIVPAMARRGSFPYEFRELVAVGFVDSAYSTAIGRARNITVDNAGWIIIQATGSARPGMSGGPMVNRCGELIGVLSLGSTGGNSMTAIYVDRDSIERLIAFAAARPTPIPPPTPAPVPTPWFATATYADPFGRWSIVYPPSWSHGADKDTWHAAYTPPIVPPSDRASSEAELSVYLYRGLGRDYTTSEWAEQAENRSASTKYMDFQVLSLQEVKVASLVAYELTYQVTYRGLLEDGRTDVTQRRGVRLLLVFGENAYIVEGRARPELWMTYENMVRSIIYTFRPTLAPNPPTLLLPRPPSGYYGEVSLNGRNVQDGTKLEVWMDGQKVAQTTTQTYNGKSVYNVDGVGDSSLEGRTVEFRLGTSVAPQKSLWRSGRNQQVALMFTAPATAQAFEPSPTSTPAPTPAATPTPSPTPTLLPPPKAVPVPTLAYGDLTQGNSGGGYSFAGKSGDVAFIRVTRGTLSDRIDVRVLDPNDKPIASSNFVPSDQLTFMPALSLTGRHTIVVSGYGQGTYTLALWNVAGGPGTPIAFGDSLVAEVSPAGDIDMFSFDRKAGGMAFIRVTRGTLSGRIDVKVFDPKGNSIADVYGLSDQVILSSPLSLAGKYSIMVSGDGKGTGTYTITLQDVGFK
ncbi:MAG: serine protease [Dehalococcoidia bacterium]|nr:serine protease [Dehalococcoidia bacterium]